MVVMYVVWSEVVIIVVLRGRHGLHRQFGAEQVSVVDNGGVGDWFIAAVVFLRVGGADSEVVRLALVGLVGFDERVGSLGASRVQMRHRLQGRRACGDCQLFLVKAVGDGS